MAITFDGLASGLKTAEIIDALMEVQAIPRTLLKAKIDDKGVVITQLQSLNTALQGLFTEAGKAKAAGSLSAFTATASSDAVRVSAGPTAQPSVTDVVVDRVATAQTTVTAAYASWPDTPPVLTIVNAEGERVEVTAASGSMADIARAIGNAGAGVSASAVAAGKDAEGKTLYRLQLTAAETGTAGAFTVYRGDADAVDAGTAIDLASEPGAATVTAAADAQVRLWAGTGAEQVVTSSSNTFTGLLPGVDVTVTKASTQPVTVTVAADTEARTKIAGDFVDRIAAILSGIDKGSKATIADGAGEQTTLGVFTGDSTVRALRRGLQEAVQHPIDGVSPSSVGISVDRYGVLTLDKEKFAEALADDPAAVEAVFTGVAARVEATTKQYSDRYDGLLTARITGQQDEVGSLEDQMERWDVRLDQRRATLERTYARLETMLSQMQSQSAYLTSQLAALPGREDS
ncbi:flagellar filament capping protein FliD [Microbacterium sp. JZ31]|uniref:flagellar filament capping protein FliD n=1 Tax=Microbacterium sp. JZ31 TaxID=1906274 RepID=UPI001931CB20|nr:flagellar filament capping protein FliD [Microbacterium sp. JZ31]